MTYSQNAQKLLKAWSSKRASLKAQASALQICYKLVCVEQKFLMKAL